jgi:hypothetical protein
MLVRSPAAKEGLLRCGYGERNTLRPRLPRLRF